MSKKLVKAKTNGVSLKELMGMKLVDVERISTQQGKNNTLIILAQVIDEDSEAVDQKVKYGIVTKEATENMLANGRVEGDKIILRLPDPDPEASMNWVNFLPESEE